MEDEVVTPEHLREWDQRNAVRKVERWTMYIRDPANGAFAGPLRSTGIPSGPTGAPGRHRRRPRLPQPRSRPLAEGGDAGEGPPRAPAGEARPHRQRQLQRPDAQDQRRDGLQAHKSWTFWQIETDRVRRVREAGGVKESPRLPPVRWPSRGGEDGPLRVQGAGDPRRACARRGSTAAGGWDLGRDSEAILNQLRGRGMATGSARDGDGMSRVILERPQEARGKHSPRTLRRAAATNSRPSPPRSRSAASDRHRRSG